MRTFTRPGAAKRVLTATLLCAGGLYLNAPATAWAKAKDPVELLSTTELQVVRHGFASRNDERTEATRTNGFTLGFAFDYYKDATMLGGWNGLESTIRMGYADAFLMQARLASVWTIHALSWIAVSAGVGVEAFWVVGNHDIAEASRFQPFPALRVGLRAGPFDIRAGYDYHVLSSAHQLRAYVKLIAGLGVGGEVSFEPLIDSKTSVNQANLLVFYAF